jgi:hypothetical protein
MNRSTWKHAESAIADLLGGRRVPVTGRQRGDAPDIDHPTLAIEVKKVGQGKRPMVNERLKEALEQATAASMESFRKDGRARTPIAIIEQTTPSRRIERYVVLTLNDFIDLTSSEEEDR